MPDLFNSQELLTDSHLAFLNRQYDTALDLAEQVIELEPSNADAYKCAGDTHMLLGELDEAIQSYGVALRLDPDNGNRYYDLGYVFALKERMTDALKNFEKARELVGINPDILQYIAVIYGIQGNIRSGLETAGQIKIILPTAYTGYRIIFQLLIKAGRLDEAEEELCKAESLIELVMDFYRDKMTLELARYQIDRDKSHLYAALDIIHNALGTVKLKAAEVIDCYINAAEIHVQLENPDKVLERR